MKITAYICAEYSEYEKKFVYSTWSHDMTGHAGMMLVEKVELEFNEPPREVLVNGTIAAYREEQKKSGRRRMAKPVGFSGASTTCFAWNTNRRRYEAFSFPYPKRRSSVPGFFLGR